MEENRLPSLFEILNRFSKPPLDLWAFYVYLNEHYGGVEYLEFWLDCAAHTVLCKELAKELLRAKRNSTANNSNGSRDSGGNPRNTREEDDSRGTHQARAPGGRVSNPVEAQPSNSPSSSVLFDILRDDALDTSSERQRNSHNSQNSSNEERDVFDTAGTLPSGPKRFSTLSDERARNKRDTVSRLSEILDNMQMPVYPSTAATSPTRNLRGSHGFEQGRAEDEKTGPAEDSQATTRGQRSSENLADKRYEASDATGGYSARNPPSTPPPRVALTSNVSPSRMSENPYIDNQERARDSAHSRGAFGNGGAGGALSATATSRLAVRESALRIIGTYLTPKAPKEIELPSDNQGWSMAEEIRQLVFIPGGLENPKVFEGATTYVFEALEREALPGFLVSRALSNVQPVSATIRLVGGLIALFGAFWLSFVYILLDWTPKSHRCWVILPFGFGWYLTITALYHIDPVLAFSGLGERDGGGIMKLQEKFVVKILAKRSLFVIVSVILLTAAFCVLFILVPGHRL